MGKTYSFPESQPAFDPPPYETMVVPMKVSVEVMRLFGIPVVVSALIPENRIGFADGQGRLFLIPKESLARG